MRLVCMLLVASLPLAAADNVSTRTPVIIAVQAREGLPPAALEEMQSELSRLFSNTNHEIRVQPLAGSIVVDDPMKLVHLRLHGECRLQLEPFLLDERGPYAITHVFEGSPSPFAEVDCRRVRMAVRKALHGGEMKESDRYIGRALARIVGHEFWHIATGRRDHSSQGLSRKSLRPAELVGEGARFAAHDEALIRMSSRSGAVRSPEKR